MRGLIGLGGHEMREEGVGRRGMGAGLQQRVVGEQEAVRFPLRLLGGMAPLTEQTGLEELLSPGWDGSREVLGNAQRQGTCPDGAQQRGELRPWLGSHGQELAWGRGGGQGSKVPRRGKSTARWLPG